MSTRTGQSEGSDNQSGSVYYQHSAALPFVSRVSFAARRRMFDLFTRVIRPLSHESALDIGVTSDTRYRESNYFEQFYPYKSQIVCVGTEDGSHLESLYPGVRFMKVEPGRPLPFGDGHFDIVFSNAVVEHVGSKRDQQAFVKEACRVGKRAFITTPNRWFPIEPHTAVPLLHFLPKPLYRWILRRTPLAYWSDEAHLNLLTFSELEALFPLGYPVRVEFAGIGVGPFRSNLVAHTASPRAASDVET